MSRNWRIFRAEKDDQGWIKPHDGIKKLLDAPSPPWRQFRNAANPANSDQPPAPYWSEAEINEYWEKLQAIAANRSRDRERGQTFCLPTQKERKPEREKIIDAVNAALYLRRPLLVTGIPGSGKTSLAYAIAHELKLGPVLTWSITTRSTLKEGLYDYDAIARLQEAQLSQPPIGQQIGQQLYEALAKLQGQSPEPSVAPNEPTASPSDPYASIGKYLRLGPLATAFLPTPYPRVLLIDEIDKSDINLPNDLLNLLEEGEVEIPELRRLATHDRPPIKVRTADGLEEIPIPGGKIPCHSFPMMIMTSNGERDFPPAFKRRCLRVTMPKPSEEDLKNIVKAHLGPEIMQEFTDIAKLIERFADQSESEAANRATDQLLNAVYLRTRNAKVEGLLEQLLFAPLNDLDENG